MTPADEERDPTETLIGTVWRTTGWLGQTRRIRVLAIEDSAVDGKPYRALAIDDDGRQDRWPLNRRKDGLASCRRSS
jgi:hypothetical protein